MRSQEANARPTVRSGGSSRRVLLQVRLESADDAEGFSFWLAIAQGASFTYSGDKTVLCLHEVASTLTWGTMNVFLLLPYFQTLT